MLHIDAGERKPRRQEARLTIIPAATQTTSIGVFMLPTECNMPDLSSLQERQAQGTFLINQLIGAEKEFPEAMGSYRRNMVRLADKAVRDYMDARRYVLSQVQEMQRTPEEMAKHGRFIYAYLTTDRLEDCILP